MITANVSGHPLRGYYCNDKLPDAAFRLRRAGFRAHQATSAEMMVRGVYRPEFTLLDGIEQYSGRVLLLAGEYNRIIGPELQRENLALFNDARLQIIKDSGHMMFGEQPQATVAAIRAHFAN